MVVVKTLAGEEVPETFAQFSYPEPQPQHWAYVVAKKFRMLRSTARKSVFAIFANWIVMNGRGAGY